MNRPDLVEHFFRHEYGRLVAVIARRSGVRHIAAIEDAVQSALMKALEVWKVSGVPDNPSAWLFRVAQNAYTGEQRQRAGRSRLLGQYAVENSASAQNDPDVFLPGEMHDDLLRMLFICCDESIPAEAQLVLALKTLCGFSIEEIAPRLFISEANAYKRLGRARNRLRKIAVSLGDLPLDQVSVRVPAVNRVLYALFAEGYFSSGADFTIRRDLYLEAIRLGTILADHPAGRTPEVFALLALMHLHAARMSGRQDEAGGLLLLEEQDRSLWDQRQIQIGLEWLAKSAAGGHVSRYHAEAGIAAEHCLAPSLSKTRWDRIVECYTLLEKIAPSPINRLSRAIAVAEWVGPAVALAELDDFEPSGYFRASYQFAAVLADLHGRCGNADVAKHYRDEALRLAPSVAIRTLLARRLQSEARVSLPLPTASPPDASSQLG